MLHEFLRGIIELIAHHGNLLPPRLQFLQKFHYAWIRLRGVKSMLHVMTAECGVSLIETWIAVAALDGTHHEQTDTVAHESPHVVDGMLRQSHAAQSIVHTCRQISQSVKQRTVKIENISAVFFHTY